MTDLEALSALGNFPVSHFPGFSLFFISRNSTIQAVRGVLFCFVLFEFRTCTKIQNEDKNRTEIEC